MHTPRIPHQNKEFPVLEGNDVHSVCEPQDPETSPLAKEIKTVLSDIKDYSRPEFWLDKDTPVKEKEKRIHLLEQQIQNLKNDIVRLAEALEQDEKHNEWEDLVF